MRNWSAERLAASTGVLFVALFVVSSFLPGTPPKIGDPAPKIAHYFFVNHRAGLVGSIVGGIALIAALWFIGTLAATIRRTGEDRLGPVALAAGLGLVAFAAINGTLATILFSRSVSFDPNTMKVLYSIVVMSATLTGFPIAAWMAATAIAAYRQRFLPRWYARASGLASVALLFGGGALAHNGFYSPSGGYVIVCLVVFLAWVLVTSGLLVWRVDAMSEGRMAQTAM